MGEENECQVIQGLILHFPAFYICKERYKKGTWPGALSVLSVDTGKISAASDYGKVTNWPRNVRADGVSRR